MGASRFNILLVFGVVCDSAQDKREGRGTQRCCVIERQAEKGVVFLLFLPITHSETILRQKETAVSAKIATFAAEIKTVAYTHKQNSTDEASKVSFS